MNTQQSRTFIFALPILAFASILLGCKSKTIGTPYDQTLSQDGTKQLCDGLTPYACQQKVQQVQAKHKEDLLKQAEAERLDKLPHADPSTPDSQYVELTSGYQLAAMYYALSAMPPDYEVLSAAASQEYRSTTDEFRKRDLLQALRGKIDSDIGRYKDPQNRYVIMEDNAIPLQHYDFKTSTFPINLNIRTGAYNYFNDSPQYKMSYNNGDKFLHLPIADQTRAEEIESMITKNELWGGRSIFYAFAQEADTTNNTVKAQIVRVVLEDRKHGEIARF